VAHALACESCTPRCFPVLTKMPPWAALFACCTEVTIFVLDIRMIHPRGTVPSQAPGVVPSGTAGTAEVDGACARWCVEMLACK
jgi:hypothetical protein